MSQKFRKNSTTIAEIDILEKEMYMETVNQKKKIRRWKVKENGG